MAIVEIAKSAKESRNGAAFVKSSAAISIPRIEGFATSRDGSKSMLEARRGRGALTNATGRFEPETRVREDDGWDLTEDLPALRTEVTQERAKTIITRND